ncbi:MAG: hypothetical protein AAF911_15335 [Planctomycetota bacterium]
MNTPTTNSPDRSSSSIWLSRWALLLALLLAGGILTASVAPTVWADDEREQRDEDFDDEDDEDEYWEEEEEELEWFMIEVGLYSELLELVLTYEEIANDPGKAGVAAVMAVEEHVQEASEAAALFEEMLPQVTNPTVERAIRLKLVDVYGEMDQPEKSIEQLKLLIKGSGQ